MRLLMLSVLAILVAPALRGQELQPNGTPSGASGTYPTLMSVPGGRAFGPALTRYRGAFEWPADAKDGHSAPARAQQWMNVRRLGPGTRIVVTVFERQRESLTCWFVAADDVQLLVSDAAGITERIARVDVAELKVFTKKDLDSVSRTLGPFALIGFAVGAGIGAAYCASHGCNGQGWAVSTSAFGMGGFLVGGAVGAGIALQRDRTVVIYRAP